MTLGRLGVGTTAFALMRQLKRVSQVHISAGEILDVFLKQLIRNGTRKIFGFIRGIIQENQQPLTRRINNR
ncbi:MAG: hypothetical protein R3C26_00515 [Calditrichia bacterium]